MRVVAPPRVTLTVSLAVIPFKYFPNSSKGEDFTNDFVNKYPSQDAIALDMIACFIEIF